MRNIFTFSHRIAIGHHMADRQRSVVNPGNKLWRQPVEVRVTQFWRPKSVIGARFRFC